jgi:hypothetical protein
MSYIGSTPTTQSFIAGTDYFNGNGSTTAFTLSRPVVSVNDIQAVVNNVVQVPNDAYNVSGTTITFTSAPSSGTGNVYVRYMSTTTQSITPSQNTVSYSTLNTDMQSGGYASNFRNRLINGAMVIDQRNAGASVTNTAGNVYTLDRWAGYGSQASKYTIQQSTTAPTGFINSLKVTSSSAYTVGSSEFFIIQQKVEGLNCADLGWGTASAATVTLSFKVYSSLTGTFGGAILNYDNSRSYPFSYTVSSANTWTNISVTVAGDTSGTWLTTNGVGIQIVWGLGAGASVSGTAGSWSGNAYYSATGATSVVGTNGATWYITGVQLEKGSTATSFDYRPYGTELALCQRYFEKSFNADTAPANNLNTTYKTTLATYDSNGAGISFIPFLVLKRTSPTMTYYSSSQTGSGSGQWQFYNGSAWANGTGTTSAGACERSDLVSFDTTLGNSSAQYCFGHWTASAEL